MKPRISLALIALFALLAISACGSDDTSGKAENNDQWELNQEPGPDTGSQDTGFQDTSSGDTDLANNPPDDPLLPPLPEGVSEEVLVGTSWHGVFRFTHDPAITGMYISLNFFEDRVEFVNDEVRDGKWSITDDGDVYLFDLDNDPPQLILAPELDDEGRIHSLDLAIPGWGVTPPYRVQFERRGTPRIELADMTGRWRAQRDITNQHGTFRLAVRIDTDGFTEVGVLNESNFVGITNGHGAIHSFSADRDFWIISPPSTSPTAFTTAGQILRHGTDLELFLFAEEPEGAFVALPFEPVPAF